MACSLSKERELLRVHCRNRAEGVEFAVRSQVGDLLQGDGAEALDAAGPVPFDMLGGEP